MPAVPASFRGRLLLLVAVGLAARLLYALVVMDGAGVRGDGEQFRLLALGLADGEGYRQPRVVAMSDVPTADKPPLYPLMLAIPSVLGWTSIEAHRIASCLMGAALVAGLGLLGRRLGGDRIALAAAGIAAVYPPLVVLDGAVRSESLYAPLIAFSLLAAYRVVDRPTVGRAAVLGALIGLAGLTRADGLALLVLLLVPLLTLLPAGRRLPAAAACALAAAVVLAPWVARNWITFDRPVLSTNYGSLLAGANCDPAYDSELIGSWPCFPRDRVAPGTDEVDLAGRLRRRGLDYARDHAERIPAVAGVRVLRTLDLWDPVDASRLESGIGDRDLTVHRTGVVAWWLVLALAIWGALILRRRGRPLRPLLAPVALVVLLSVVGYGSTRFRAAGEVPAVVLAAVTCVALLGRRRSPPGPVPGT